MKSNLEIFITGEAAIKLDNAKDVVNLFNKMTMIGFSSIRENNMEEIMKKATSGYVVEYIPGQGFIFNDISEINALTDDMYQNNIEIIDVDELFQEKVAV